MAVLARPAPRLTAGDPLRTPRLRLPAKVAAALSVACLAPDGGHARLVDVSRQGLRVVMRKLPEVNDTLTLSFGGGRATTVIEAAVCWRRPLRARLGEAGLRVRAQSLVPWHALLQTRIVPRLAAPLALLPLGLPHDSPRIVLLAPDPAQAARLAGRLRATGLRAEAAAPGARGVAGADVVVVGPYPSVALARADLERLGPPAGRQTPLVIALVPGADAIACRRLIEAGGVFDCVTDRRWGPVLEVRLTAALRLADQLRQTDARIEELAELSGRDPLTGLFNRRHFFALAADEAERARRSGEPLALALLDLDHFKQVNDLYGHEAGDRVLRTLARLLQGHLRAFDLVARYGGDEVVLLLPGANVDGGARAAERIRALVEATSFDPQQIVRLTLSIGVVLSEPSHPLPIAPLLASADRALYRAKQSGRNQVRLGVLDPLSATSDSPDA